MTAIFQCILFYNKLPPPKVISGLLSNVQKVGLFCVILVSFHLNFRGPSAVLVHSSEIFSDIQWYSKKNIPRTVLENETFLRNTSSAPRTVLEHGKKFGCTRKFRILGLTPTPHMKKGQWLHSYLIHSSERPRPLVGRGWRQTIFLNSLVHVNFFFRVLGPS